MARRDLADSNGEAQRRHHLSEYTDDEKRWLVKAEEEEREKGRGFMARLKRRWDEQSEKCKVSQQNLRDNAVRFKREINIDVEAEDNTNGSENLRTAKSEWTNEMKINLLRIEGRERSRGRGFMKRMKQEWDLIYEDKPMSAQCLRDNAARFRKDKALVNLTEIRDGRDLEPEQAEQSGCDNENLQQEELDVEHENVEAEKNINNRERDYENKQEDEGEREREEENEDMREMRTRFIRT